MHAFRSDPPTAATISAFRAEPGFGTGIGGVIGGTGGTGTGTPGEPGEPGGDGTGEGCSVGGGDGSFGFGFEVVPAGLEVVDVLGDVDWAGGGAGPGLDEGAAADGPGLPVALVVDACAALVAQSRVIAVRTAGLEPFPPVSNA